MKDVEKLGIELGWCTSATPIEYPSQHDSTCVAPFTQCDREKDYRRTWEEFEGRERKGDESC